MEFLRILHVTPFFRGGVGIVAYNLTREFVRMGHELILATPVAIPQELRNFMVNYYKLHNPFIRDPFYASIFYLLNLKEIEKIVNHEKPDVILTHGPLVIISRTIKKYLIISIIHGTYANEIKWIRYHPIFGFDKVRYLVGIYTTYYTDMRLYRTVAGLENVWLIAVSKNARKELIEAGVQPIKVFSILNGVDKEVFKPMNKDYAKALVEEMFKVKLKNKLLLHVNPGPRKGTHTLLKAVAMLRKLYGNDFTLVIVGRLGSTSYRRYIEDMIKCLKLEENVKLLDYIEYEKLPILYNAADLTIVPSYSEGGPLVTPESLACGTPVIATDVGGNPEYLSLSGLNNLLVQINKYDFSDKLANKIFFALQSKDKIKPKDAIYSWSQVARTYINVLLRLTR